MCCCKQGRLSQCPRSGNTSPPERATLYIDHSQKYPLPGRCPLLKQPAGGAPDASGVGEMGCSSAQPDPDRSRARDGSIPAAGGAEDLSTLERLAQATGGMEESWYRCVFPFGVISLVIGVAGSGVTFSFNTLPQTRVVSLVLLVLGFVLLLVVAAFWKAHRSRRREKEEAGIFSSELYTL